MGKTLRGYVTREILGAFLGGLALFSFILFVARILDLTDLVIARGVPATDVLRLFGYVVPSFLEVALPMAALLGVVVAFARMSSDGEMLALRGAGLSLWQLSRPAVAVGVVAAATTLVVAGWVRPWAAREIGETVYDIAKTRVTAALRPRVFNSLADGLVLYAEHVDPERQQLEGVLISDERDRSRRTTVLAASARMVAEEQAKAVYLRLSDGTSVTYQSARDSYDTTSFVSYEVNLDLARHLAVAPGAGPSPEQMYPHELVAARARPGNAAFAATIELHRRLAYAVAAILLAVMGVPLGMQPSRAIRARGLSVSLLVVLGYYVLFSAALGLARSRILDPAVAMWMPDAVFALIVVAMLGRAAADRSPYPSPAALAHVFAPARRLAAS
jgi:lipopolysaccharide export system permease protein